MKYYWINVKLKRCYTYNKILWFNETNKNVLSFLGIIPMEFVHQIHQKKKVHI